MTHYIHNVPGRLRVSIPSIKGNDAACEQVRSMLMSLDGVREVTVSTVTGSVLIIYASGIMHHNELLDLLHERGYYKPDRAVTHDQYIDRMASKAGRIVGRAVMGAFVENAISGTPLSLLALLI